MEQYQGLAGFNTRTLGVSRDQIMAAAVKVKGAFLLAMDDPDLVREAKGAGMRVIYRQSGDEQLPSSNKDADIKVAAYAFVQTRAEKGADVIHFTNEQGPSPKLHVFTKYCYQCCHENGWVGVGYNYATHTSAELWNDPEGIEVMRYAALTRQYVGAHAYMDGADDAAAFPFLALKAQLGLSMILTEFALARDLVTKRGWRGITTPQQRRDFITQWIAWQLEQNIPACYFCFDPWNQPTPAQAKAEGFGYWDYDDVIVTMSNTNVNHLWKETTVNPAPSYPDPSKYTYINGYCASTQKNLANLRDIPSPNGKDIGDIHKGDAAVYSIQTFANAGFQWRYLQDRKGWVADVATFAPGAAEVPTLLLNLPYFTQSGNRIENDCGPASAGEFIVAYYGAHGIAQPALLTLAKLIADTPLAQTDRPLSLQEVKTLITGWGVPCEIQINLTRDVLINRLRSDSLPILMLANAKYWWPGVTRDIGHIITVKGYSAESIIIDDPTQGATISLPNAVFDQAVTDLGVYAWQDYQGIVSAPAPVH